MRAKVLIILIFICKSFLFSQTTEKDVSQYFEVDKNRVVKYKNIVKLNYLRASLNGNAVFSYERYLTPLLSLEIEGGLTYYNLFGMMVGNISDEPSYFDSGYKFGFSAGAGLRIYPKKDEMEGFYINPAYRLLNYNHKDAGNSSIDIKRYLHDVCLIVGLQKHYSRWTLEYYLGSGVRFSQLGYTSVQQPLQEEVKINKILPLLLIGARIGYNF